MNKNPRCCMTTSCRQINTTDGQSTSWCFDTNSSFGTMAWGNMLRRFSATFWYCGIEFPFQGHPRSKVIADSEPLRSSSQCNWCSIALTVNLVAFRRHKKYDIFTTQWPFWHQWGSEVMMQFTNLAPQQINCNRHPWSTGRYGTFSQLLPWKVPIKVLQGQRSQQILNLNCQVLISVQ